MIPTNFILFSYQSLFSKPPGYQGPAWDRRYTVSNWNTPRRVESIAVLKPFDRIARIVAGWFGRRPYGF